MTRFRRFIAGLVLLALAGSWAHAAPFTSYFDALATELALRAAELAGSTDPAAKKQLKAIGKTLAAIDKPSTSLLTDLKTAGKVAKKLGKAFPEEIPSAEGSLGALLSALFDSLDDDVGLLVKEASAAAFEVPDLPCKGKVDTKVQKAQDALSAAFGKVLFAERAKFLRQALKGAGKAQKAIDKCSGSGGGECGTENFVDVTVNTVALPFANASYFRGGDVQALVVGASNEGKGSDELSLVAHGVNGTRTFDIHPSSTFIQDGDMTFFPGSTYTVTGTLTLTKFVYSNNLLNDDCFAGSIDVTFTNGVVTKEIDGSFDLSQLGIP